MTEDVTVNSPSHEEDFDDVGCNADLYAARQETGRVSGFRARVEVVTSDHNNRMIPIVFSHLVLTKSWKLNGEVAFMECS